VAAAGALSSAAAPADLPARWCGDRVDRDRPDVFQAFQTHVVYAVPADAPDRLEDRALGIVRDLSAIDAWWRAQDHTRSPRFDTAAFSGCTGFEALDLSTVRLPRDSAHYRDVFDPYSRIVADVAASPSSFDDHDKKYLVFFDGPVARSAVCGTSSRAAEGGRRSMSVIYLASVCGAELGNGTRTAVTAVHELIHSLGALPTPPRSAGPPNACPRSPSHACDDRRDILWATARSDDSLAGKLLDVGGDDYYGHSGTWDDLQDSPYLWRLDGETPPPLGAVAELSATSRDTVVFLSWTPAAAAEYATRYRVYRDGRLLSTTNDLDDFDSGLPGQTVVYGVRAVAEGGFLGPMTTIRFTLGLGIVDEAGVLVRDTVAPSEVDDVQAVERPRGAVRLRWSPASDAGGVRGYVVARGGHRVGGLVRSTSLSIQRPAAVGRWTVRAVDQAGNLGPASEPVLVPVRPPA
jgi:hypothetical protein